MVLNITFYYQQKFTYIYILRYILQILKVKIFLKTFTCYFNFKIENFQYTLSVIVSSCETGLELIFTNNMFDK